MADFSFFFKKLNPNDFISKQHTAHKNHAKELETNSEGLCGALSLSLFCVACSHHGGDVAFACGFPAPRQRARRVRLGRSCLRGLGARRASEGKRHVGRREPRRRQTLGTRTHNAFTATRKAPQVTMHNAHVLIRRKKKKGRSRESVWCVLGIATRDVQTKTGGGAWDLVGGSRQKRERCRGVGPRARARLPVPVHAPERALRRGHVACVGRVQQQLNSSQLVARHRAVAVCARITPVKGLPSSDKKKERRT